MTFAIACKNGAAGAVCSGPITLSASGGKEVGSGSYSVATGEEARVTISLDPAGQALLAKSYKMPATLALAGTSTVTRMVHFHYARVLSPIAYTFDFTEFATTIPVLTISKIPEGGTVGVICQGGGCPFKSRAFSPSAGAVALAPSFKGARLRVGSTLEVEITVNNEVGKVAIFEIHSGQQPTLTEQCLAPGASNPSRCA